MRQLSLLLEAAFKPAELAFLRNHPEFIKGLENAAHTSSPSEHFTQLCTLGNALLVREKLHDQSRYTPPGC